MNAVVAITLPFDFADPAWLWLLLLIPVLGVASLRSLAGLDPPRRFLALAARSILLILLVCCLAGIAHVQRNHDLTVIFLMDRSHSVSGTEEHQEEFIREAADTMHADDRLGVIEFAREAYLVQLPMTGGYFVPPGRFRMMTGTDRTNIGAALRLAMAMFPHDTAKRIVLMSDGSDNMGDVLSEVRRATADGIPIDVMPMWYEHRNEVAFERLIVPTHAAPGEQVPIRPVLTTHRPASGAIDLYHNGRLVPLAPEDARVELQPGSNTFFVKLPVDTPGTHVFEAVFRPDDPSMDAIALNNTAGGFTFVSGAGSVLLLTANPQHDQTLYDALQSEKINVEMKTPAQLGDFGLLEMMNYSSIILANIPAATFTDAQQKQLAGYVKDMGSGLIMVGGDESFGAGGWIGSPLEEVMPVSFEIKHKRVIPRGALVLVMHSCEIPRGNYWGKEMAKKSVDTISSQDYIGVLAYSWSPMGPNWEVPVGLATNKSAVKAAINRMQIGDMPDFVTTMDMAYKELTTGIARDAAQKHVIILSDGDPQPPSDARLAAYREAKITVSTIGIGWGAHVMQAPMQRIAAATGGKFYPAQNPRQLPQIFVKESKVVRRPLIIDEPFQPRLFHVYSELLGGIDAADALPPLGGMVLTQAKDSPLVTIPIIRPTDDGDDPVLAHWHHELGRSAVFTSGFWPFWGEDWTRWPKFARFWAQLVRWSMRQETPANFDTYTKVEGNRARIVVDALASDATYLNLLQLRTRVVGPDHRPVPVEFTQTGPGHYEAELPIDQSGQYLASVQIYDPAGQPMGTIRTGLSVPYSPEYKDLRTNEAILRQVAEISGGRWLEVPGREARVFVRDLPPVTAKRPVWEWVLAWLLLPLFLLDVAVRRLANWLAFSIAVEVVVLLVLLFGVGLAYAPPWGVLGAFLLADLIGWIIRFRYIAPMFDWLTHTVTALGQAGERSEAALDQLRSAKQRARAGLREKADVRPGKDVAEEAVPRAVAARRFDVGDRAAKKTAGDLQEALDAARPADASDRRRSQPESETATDHSTTSRLLKARERSRKRDQT